MIGESDQRPWGSWHVIDAGDGYQVKKIVVAPHQRLSYQYHQHRAEHWAIVTGKATCIINGRTSVAGPGDCVDVPVETHHRILNNEDEDLVLIEVQLGHYLGEDDIVRIEDDYGRCD